MADYIPFVNSGNDLVRLRTYYDQPIVVRVALASLPALRKRGIDRYALWVDTEMDGYHHLLEGGRVWPDWRQYVSQFDEADALGDASFIRRPDPARVGGVVTTAMEKCRESGATWITIPQLPMVGDSTRNKINVMLAEATASWKKEHKFAGRLVLPVVFTHQEQLRGRTQWSPKLKIVQKCYNTIEPGLLWIVDSDLSDWKGSARFTDRFQSLIGFHTDVRDRLPDAKVVAGPYWGMNLVLWARKLCDYPAITLGYGFKYRVSGGYRGMDPAATVALPPLRRLARHTEELGSWLDAAIGGLDESDDAYKELRRIRDSFEQLKDYEVARNQAAKFYGGWVRRLCAIPPEGRSLALFQELASAYVLGKKMERLPKEESPGRDAGKVAEQLMLHCL
jgi:hypothetical protein